MVSASVRHDFIAMSENTGSNAYQDACIAHLSVPVLMPAAVYNQPKKPPHAGRSPHDGNDGYGCKIGHFGNLANRKRNTRTSGSLLLKSMCLSNCVRSMTKF